MTTIIFQAKKKKFKKVKKTQTVNQNKILPELSDEINFLLTKYQKILSNELEDGKKPTLKVGEVFSSVAYAYERLRNMIDYKGDHLLVRNAIFRILTRRLWHNLAENPTKVSLGLVKELIWARYLKNDSIPESRVDEIAKVLAKYQYLLLDLITKYPRASQKYLYWKDRIVELCSCEIELLLYPELAFSDDLAQGMQNWFLKNYTWDDSDLTDDAKNEQIYIAINKSLLKSDDARVRFRLLNKLNPEWGNTKKFSDQEIQTISAIDEVLHSPLQRHLFRFIQKRTAPFQILKSLFLENKHNTKEIIGDPEKFNSEITRLADLRYSEVRTKVNTGITRSIIYIFITKMLLAMAVEYPYEKFIIQSISWLPITINLLFPPSFMFIVGMAIKKPGEQDTKILLERISGFVSPKKDESKKHFSLKLAKGEGIWDEVFLFLYTSLSLLILLMVTLTLRQIGFNFLSIAIFFLFTSTVLLFGFRIRYTAGEYRMTTEREGLAAHLFSLLTLPFLRLGVIFSQTISRFNFLILIMDFIFEAPIKNIVAVVDEWGGYIRRKQEEVIEVPQD
ncbi:hypothetical protein A2382_01695 [Candidatus Woesebacteria bacterium RIFOXYB1_FULL_38_16]|uniref:Uncharacterized protein n=1 Tax=Candidatus Woesebacteria bacterium RIFOXYB1_FULL_38_16 TaxID=1802538 RepID=A0A1F8CVN8_9BACT|nr:MAG: hypothetical protein A2191_03270 [Candidatus Woesebacteria bacterium RIFOXYA1_FULL_38_9]OGM80136.1 MAG: hypothetical protein A2382_01695 [Candidatus Woesebacteria bacterium RIFOXYB1_FULL_38_16]